MSGSVRLFIALWPDGETRERIARWQQAWTWPPGARLVPPPKLHVTLHFLGNVAVEAVPAVGDALPPPGDPFELEFGEPSLFTGGIAIVKPLAQPAALLDLHAAIARALERVALPVEARTYRPHVTLARKAPAAQPPQEPLRCTWRARDYVLVRSSPQGGYEILARYGPQPVRVDAGSGPP